MKMLTGAYSQKFKELEQEGLTRSNSTDSLTHTQQLAARDKVRQLSLETNRRRRAQELKRRLEAQKETKRRQEVLEERRRRQHEATQKYQRGQRGPAKAAPRTGSGKSYSDSRLQDGVQISRGYGHNGTYPGNHGNRAPALEEALKLVGASTAPAGSINYRGGGYSGGADYPTGYRGGHSDGGATYSRENSATDGPHRRPALDANGNAVSDGKGHSYHGYPTTATATYNGSRDAAGQRFQQTLHEQQRQLVEQQQAALSEFNRAVLTETLPSQGEEVQRSSSLSSLDSLEEEQPRPRKNHTHHASGSAVSKSNQASTKPREDHTAVVNSTSPYGRNDTRTVTNGSAAATDRFFTSQSVSHRQPSEPGDAHTTTVKERAGELLVEETSESDFVREPVMESSPVFLQGSRGSDSQRQSCGGHAASRGPQAWALQSPADGPQVHRAYDASHSPARHSAGPVSVQAGHQLFPARTTATAVSSYPARLPDPPADYSQRLGHKVSEHDPARTAAGSVNPRTVSFSPADAQTGGRLQAGDSPAREYHPKRDETPQTPERIVKSILKRTQGNNSASSQRVKLGGFKVKDSLEISRGSQSSRSDRKSVRWTDLNYVDEEARTDEDRRAASSSAGKPERFRPSAKRSEDGHDAVQAKVQHAAVSGTPPRGPTRLQRKAHPTSKPPAPRSGHTGTHKTPEADHSRAATRSSQRVPNHQHETNDKQVAASGSNSRVYPNGVHLDKTPTDDEINWLWDKVRTCLNTQEQGTTGSDSSVGRQPTSVSKQCIDGNRLTANLRVHAPAPPQDLPTAGPKKYNTYPRLRTNSDAGSSSLRKTALLHQRRQHGTGGHVRAGYQGRSGPHYAGIQPSPPTSGNPHQAGPAGSSQGPTRTAGGASHVQDGEVSDSLLAFQHAEHLAAQEGLSEADIAAAMEHSRTNAFMQKAPTALSMEEQRILESLDKLNAQLRTVTSETNAATQPFMMMQPKPPPQGSAYRSQRPISARQKAAANPSIAHRVRTLSADRSNARINYYH